MKKISNFLKECREELKRVSWPTRKELMDSTKVVIISALILMVIIAIFDYLLSKAINYVLS